MISVNNFLKDNEVELDFETKKYVEALESYEKTFGDINDLNEYVSTWDYDDNDFIEFTKKIENCVAKRKRYKYLYVNWFYRTFHKLICKIKYSFIDE